MESKEIQEKRNYFRVKQREWREENPERAREIQKKYYDSHREERIASSMRRYWKKQSLKPKRSPRRADSQGLDRSQSQLRIFCLAATS